MDWCSHEEVLIFLSFCVLGLFGVLSFEDFEDAWSVITKHIGPTGDASVGRVETQGNPV